MKRPIAVIIGFLAATALATDYYVDAVHGNDDWSGTSSNRVGETTTGPRKTLAGVIALATQPGDVIWALPGNYDEGTMSGDTNRLYVSAKDISLKSTGGKEVTHIVGHHTAGDTYGFGADALRCVEVAKDCNFLIDGFTIRDGAGKSNTKTASVYGGGVACTAGRPSKGKSNFTLVDCVVSNCVSYRGAGIYAGRAIRCRLTDNYGSNSASAAQYAELAHCVIDANRGNHAISTCEILVNCTVFGNTKDFGGTAAFAIYNTLVFGQPSGGHDQVSLYNSVASSGDAFKEVDDVSVTDAGAYQCISPYSGDFRLLSASPAVGIGNADHLALVALPAGYDNRDFLGNPIDVSAPLAAGACQTAVAQPASRVVFGEVGDGVRVDGMDHLFVKGEYFFPAEYPVTYRMKAVSGGSVRRVFGFYMDEFKDGTRSIYNVPQYDGWVCLMPNPDVAGTTTVNVREAAAVFYADADAGDDEYDGTAPLFEGGKKGPKKTLQDAVDLCTANYSLVLARGTFAEGGWNNGNGYSNRLHIATYTGVIAADGIGSATIVGAPSPETGALGPNAVAGVWNDGNYGYVQGFVITGCFTPDDDSSGCRGAAVHCKQIYSQIMDCVISNNTANTASGMYVGTAIRTRFLENHSVAYVVNNVRCTACAFAGNTFGGEAGSGGRSCLSGSADAAVAWNCTFIPGEDNRATQNADVKIYDGIVTCCHGKQPTDSLVSTLLSENAVLADVDGYDFRLGVLSPAIGYADAGSCTEGNMYFYPASDLFGNPYAVRNGRVTVGAVHNEPGLPVTVIVGEGGGVSAEGAPIGTNCVFSVAEITVTATDAARRPFKGFEIDGVLQPLGADTVSVVPSTDPAAVTSVRAIYGTDWYVDQATGADGNRGSFAACPKRTIRAASTNAVSGDVIHVGPGVYGTEEGATAFISTTTVKARVVLGDGVSIESTDGPSSTFVVGGEATTGLDAYGFGTGSDAVKCMVVGVNAAVKGFSLVGGRSGNTSGNENGYGAAIFCSAGDETDDMAFVENCVISNNAAYGGALWGCNLVRCRILDNTGLTRSPAGANCRYYGCVIDRNKGTKLFDRVYGFDSCTVGPDNDPTDMKGANANVFNSMSCAILNSLDLLNVSVGKSVAATNSAFLTKRYSGTSQYGCIIADAEALAVDADYRPIIGSNVAIDKGNLALSGSEYAGQTDIWGGQRVMNAVQDMGAVEADWRTRYARDLGRGNSVSAVSPEVSETEDRTLLMPSGSIAGRTREETCDYGLVFDLQGPGTLNLYLGSVLVGSYATEGDGQTATFPEIAAATEFKLEFIPEEPSAFACVRRFKIANRGSLLILR